MKKFLFLTIACLCIGSVIFSVYKSQSSTRNPHLTIGQTRLAIEIASTPAQIRLGLGERDTLGSDGMLFVMPNRGIPSFWMKGMRFDLDFVWIDGNTVVDLTERVPAQIGVPERELQTYSPRVPVTHVLELNAGQIQAHGIKKGDKVTF